MKINLKIPLKPIPHQSVRMTRSGHTYQPKRILDYKESIRTAVREQLPSGFSVIEADTLIHVTKLHYCYAFPKSFSKKKKESGLIFKHTKPDLHDNLNKPLFDALEGLVWERDQNVVSINDLRKYYAEEDGIILEIEC